MTTRTELDAWLLDQARAAGAEVRAPCRVGEVEEGPERVVVHTDRRRPVGRAGDRRRRHRQPPGAGHRRTPVAGRPGTGGRGRGRPASRRSGPSGSTSTGARSPARTPGCSPRATSSRSASSPRRASPEKTKEYLQAFLRAQGLDRQRVVHDSGHLTRCRAPGSPLGRGRILLAGDAAGLLEPWTREGISFAVRSGALAGAIAARHSDDLQAAYAAAIGYELVPEMEAGEICRQAFEKRPGRVPRPAVRHVGRLAPVRPAHPR